VRLVSIDEVVLKGVEIVSGTRVLTGDVDIVPQGAGATIRNITLKAEDTSVTITGTINDLSGPIGNLTVKSGTLNVDRLVAFANDFAAGAGLASAPKQTPAPAAQTTVKAPAANLLMSLAADRATMGGLAIDDLVGRATMIGTELSLKPLAFKMFGGQYDGGITVALGERPTFHWKAGISGLDVNKAATFAGSPNTISGKLAATIDVTGTGADAATALKTVRGAARIDIANGVINNLGLVRTVVAATTLDKTAVQNAASGSHDEPFTKLGATLSIANGSASTQDLRLESKDLTVAAAGALKLDGSAVDMRGDVQLSPELTKQAGSTLVRVSQQDGRVTLPLTVKGAAGSYGVSVDASAMAKRAITNEVNDQAQKAMKKGLGGLFKH
jgi:AsmA protein